MKTALLPVAAAAVLLAACADDRPDRSGPTSAPTSAATAAPAPPSSAPARRDAMLPAGYHPLWPFRDPAGVRAWQRSYRDGGHAPWHLDAERTALSFTRDFLGFTGLDRTTSRRISGAHARIGVGYRGEDGRPATAAVIHLIRAGTGADAPWEVVGTDDTAFSLTAPAYGSRASSPVAVGGRITGVDESIRVQVHRAGTDRPLGRYCCLPAGGQNSAWSARVSFTAPPGGVLTIVASTGGHVADVERFAVTAVLS